MFIRTNASTCADWEIEDCVSGAEINVPKKLAHLIGSIRSIYILVFYWAHIININNANLATWTRCFILSQTGREPNWHCLEMRIFALFAFFVKYFEMALQCKTAESSYGSYLAHHIISSHPAEEPLQCTLLCQKVDKCDSWNFWMDDKKCELNDADSYSHGQDLKKGNRVIYSDTLESPRNAVRGWLLTPENDVYKRTFVPNSVAILYNSFCGLLEFYNCVYT